MASEQNSDASRINSLENLEISKESNINKNSDNTNKSNDSLNIVSNTISNTASTNSLKNPEELSKEPKLYSKGRRRKELPRDYIKCDSSDIINLITSMLNDLTKLNDSLPLKTSQLTRFHSRAAPRISAQNYLLRLTKYCFIEKATLLATVYLIDIYCLASTTFTVNSLTIHRFLLTAITVASKGLCDTFCTNSHYARVGGVSLAELNLLELELLEKVSWKIVPPPETLIEYYEKLIKRLDSEYSLEPYNHNPIGIQQDTIKDDIDFNFPNSSSDYINTINSSNNVFPVLNVDSSYPVIDNNNFSNQLQFTDQPNLTQFSNEITNQAKSENTQEAQNQIDYSDQKNKIGFPKSPNQFNFSDSQNQLKFSNQKNQLISSDSQYQSNFTDSSIQVNSSDQQNQVNTPESGNHIKNVANSLNNLIPRSPSQLFTTFLGTSNMKTNSSRPKKSRIL